MILLLSLGLLAKTSGQVSLCHITFAAIGAVAFSKLSSGGVPWIPALLIGGLVVVPIGAILAIPAIRLSGLYLALATFGFGLLVQDMFYNSNVMFGVTNIGISMPMPHLSWLTVDSSTGFYYVVLLIVALAADRGGRPHPQPPRPPAALDVGLAARADHQRHQRARHDGDRLLHLGVPRRDRRRAVRDGGVHRVRRQLPAA